MADRRIARLQQLISSAGSQALLAREHGFEPSYLSQLVHRHRSFGEKAARSMEKKLGLAEGWLDQPIDEAAASSADAARVENVSIGPPVKGKVPLISSIRAGTWSDANDPYQPGDAQDWLPCPASRYSDKTYCLRVEGDSMTAPYGRSYPEGSIIFVDPQQNGITPGDRVIAKLPGQEQVTFKQLATDGVKYYLKALNPHHPPVFGEFEVIGKVIGTWLPE